MTNLRTIGVLSTGVVLTVMLCTSPAPGQAVTDWPGWMGPKRDGVSAEKGWNAKRLKIAWRKEVGLGYSGVSVVGQRVYTMGNAGGKDTVWCLSAADGSVIWRRSYNCQGGGRGFPGTRMTPLVDDSRVYTMSLKAQIYCLDAKTGKVVWNRNTVKELGAKGGRHGFSCHPVIDGKRLFVELGARGGTVVAFDKKSGKVLWRSGRYRCGHSSPVVRTIGGKRQLIVWTADALVGMNPANGKELWKYPTRIKWWCNIATPVFWGEKVFISSVYYDRGSTLLDLSSGKPKVVWHSKRMQNQCSSTLVYEDHLYGFDGWVEGKKATKGVLRCIELKSAREKWSKKGLRTGSVTIAGGRLILLSDRGVLAVAEASPRGFKQLSRAKVLSGRCWNMPVLSGGRIYCRSFEGELVCVDVRKKR